MYSVVSMTTTHEPLLACLMVKFLSCLNVFRASRSLRVKLSVVGMSCIWSMCV